MGMAASGPSALPALALITYLVAGDCEPLVIIFKFENLIMMYFPDRRWIVKKADLNLWGHWLLLLVVLSSHLEVVLDL
jgi:hypothetical protein